MPLYHQEISQKMNQVIVHYIQCTLYNIQCTLYNLLCVIHYYIRCYVLLVICLCVCTHCTTYSEYNVCTTYPDTVRRTVYVVQYAVYVVHTLYAAHSVYNSHCIVYRINHCIQFKVKNVKLKSRVSRLKYRKWYKSIVVRRI